MNIQLTFDSSCDGAPAGYKEAFQYVADALDALISDNITINIQVSYNTLLGQTLSSGALAESNSGYEQYFTYAQIVSALQAHSTSAIDQSFIATLPTQDPTNGGKYYLSSAQARMLGLQTQATNSDGYDGYIALNASYNFTFDPNNRAVPGEYDAIGVIAHEITEILGRRQDLGTLLINNASDAYAIADLMHYTAGGLSLTAGPGSLSLDGGKTLLRTFNDPNNGGDAADWAYPDVKGDSFGSGDSGIMLPMSAVDLAMMDALGYSLAPQTSYYAVDESDLNIALSQWNANGAASLAATAFSLDVSTSFALDGSVTPVNLTAQNVRLTISGQPMTGSGGLSVTEGTLELANSNSFTGGVSIGGGGTLKLDKADSAGSGTISFTGAGGTLDVDPSALPTNTIDGFGAGDTIDVANFTAVKASFEGNSLVLTNAAGVTETLKLGTSQDYSGQVFYVSGDGNGGTDVGIGSTLIWQQGSSGATNGDYFNGPLNWTAPGSPNLTTGAYPGEDTIADMTTLGANGATYTVTVGNEDIIVRDSNGNVESETQYFNYDALGVKLGVDTTLLIDANSFNLGVGGAQNDGTIKVDTTLTLGRTGTTGATISFDKGTGSGGSVVLNDQTPATITGVDPTTTWVVGAQTVSGGGAINNLHLEIAGGTVEASSTAKQLRIDSTNGILNLGTLGAIGGATLSTGGTISQSFFSNAGTLSATGSGSVVALDDGTDIVGGNLSTSGGGVIRAAGKLTFDGSASQITDNASVDIAGNTQLTLLGAIDNDGIVSLHGNDYYSTVARVAVSGAVKLSGAGIINLSDDNGPRSSDSARISGANNSGDALDNVGNTIQGIGRLGDGNLHIINETAGQILATLGTLYVNPGAAGMTNAGLISSQSATLDLTGTINNSGGTLNAGAADLDIHDASITNGLLTSNGAGVMHITGATTLSGTSGVASGASAPTGGLLIATNLHVDGSQALTLENAITNASQISAHGNDYYSTVAKILVSGTATLTGGGQIALADDNGPRSSSVALLSGANSSGDLLVNADNMIHGIGSIGGSNLSITNQAAGSIVADNSVLTVNVGTGTLTNQGIIKSVAGGELNLMSDVANTGATLGAFGGSWFDLNAMKVTSGLLTGDSKSGGFRVTGGSASLDNVAVGSTTQLDVGGSESLKLFDTLSNASNIQVHGNDYYSTTANLLISGAVTLTGGGSVTLWDDNNHDDPSRGMVKAANTSGDSLDNQNNLITGVGTIGLGKLSLTNEVGGTIRNSDNRTIAIDLASFTNKGLVQASNGQIILIGGVDNSGTISTAKNGVVTLGGTRADGSAKLAGVIRGGTLSSDGTGEFQTSAPGSVLDGTSGHAITSSALIYINPSQALIVKGSIANSGTIAIHGNDYYSTVGSLLIDGTAALSGGGSITLTDDNGPKSTAMARITGLNGSADAMENIDDTISGTGSIGGGALTFTNDSKGTLLAGAGQTLVLDAGALTNSGSVQANGGSVVLLGTLNNSSGGTVSETGGTLYLGGTRPGTNTFVAGTVIGGMLTGDATSQVIASAGAVLDGTGAHAVTTNLKFDIGANQNLTLKGTIVSSGTLSVHASSYYGTSATLLVQGALALEGGGTISLNDDNGSRDTSRANIRATTAGDSFDNIDNTIQGTGTIGGNGLSFTNEAGGTIKAASGQVMVLDAGTLTNKGAVRADGGEIVVVGTLDQSGGGTLTATSGTILLGSGGRSGTIAGGTLTGNAGSIVQVSGTGSVLDGSNGHSLTMNAAVDIGGSQNLTLAGQIASAGTITVHGNSYYGTLSTLLITGTVALSGGGVVTLRDDNSSDSSRGLLSGVHSSGDLLDIVDNTLQGNGTIGGSNLSVTTEAKGIVLANNDTLVINTGTGVFTNHGLLEANGGTLSITGGTITSDGSVLAHAGSVQFGAGATLANFADGTLTGGTWEADQGATLVLGGVAALTTLAAHAIESGTGWLSSGPQGAALDGTLAQIAMGGILDLESGHNWSGTQSLANAGEIRLGGITLGGSGAITNSGKIDGTGTIAEAVDNSQGLIEASGGVLTLGQAEGGRLQVDGGATLVLDSGTLAGAHVSLAAGATLELANDTPFDLTVDNFTQGSILDIADGSATGAYDAATNTLTVSANGTVLGALHFTAGSGDFFALASDGHGGKELIGFDPLEYAASNPDLIAAIGDNPQALIQHYVTYGYKEGRPLTSFDPLEYAASNPDLIPVLGDNPEALIKHYVDYGFSENRPTGSFDPLEYAASNPDLIPVLGDNPAALIKHYVDYGFSENRPTGSFDPLEYAASNPDLIRVLGDNPAALIKHYVDYGFSENRPTGSFDPLEYAASNPDLIRVLGDNPAALIKHYVDYGFSENRPTGSFDPLEYAASNPDLIAAGLGGDPLALERHYVDYGFQEGRSVNSFDAVAYLLSYPDLEAAGLGPSGALQQWVASGASQGRIGDALFGHDQASHSIALGSSLASTIDWGGDHDWFEVTLGAGQSTEIDLGGGNGTAVQNPFLQLFDSAGHMLNSATGASTASLEFTASAAGTYYIAASSTSASATGSYALTVLPH